MADQFAAADLEASLPGAVPETERKTPVSTVLSPVGNHGSGGALAQLRSPVALASSLRRLRTAVAELTPSPEAARKGSKAALLSPKNKPQNSTTHASVFYEGFLLKLKTNTQQLPGASKFNKRYFMLKGPLFLYFRQQGDSSPAGWLRVGQIRTIETTTIENHPQLSAIVLSLKSRKLTLQCKDATEASQWVDAIQASKEANKHESRLAPHTPEGERPRRPEITVPGATAPVPSSGLLSPHSARLGSGKKLPPPPEHASSAMQIAYTRAWDDAEMAYYFYTDTQSYWDLPQSHPGGEWVLVWDLAMEAPIYFHTGTHAESAVADVDGQFYAHLPTGEGGGADADAQWGGDAVQEDAVWLEAWDDTYQTPYYVHVLSGASQWEWPDTGYVVQYGSEDYDHWWNQGQRAFEFHDGADDAASGAADDVIAVHSTAPAADGSAAQATPTSMDSNDHRLLAQAFSTPAPAPAAAGDAKSTPVGTGSGQHKGQPTPPPKASGGGGGSHAAMELRRAASGRSKA